MEKILIVDDDHDVRLYLGEFLESRGYSCVSVENGAQALTEMKVSEFQLVITDLNMPLMNGLELISNIKKTDNELSAIPIILLTGELNPSSDYDDLHAETIGILNKPFEKNELLAMVSDALHQNSSASLQR